MSELNELETLMMEWYALCEQMVPLEEALAPIKAMKELREAKIKDLIKKMGKGYAAPHLGVEASYRKGYTKVTWDGSALDGFAAAHPEILPFRSEKATQPSISIKKIDKLPF